MSSYVHEISPNEAEKIRSFLKWLAIGTVAFVLVIAVAIVTADRWLLLISHESERRFVEPYISWGSEKLLGDPDIVLQNYVESLALELAEDLELDDDMQLQIRVIEGGPINAFAMLGGYIFIFEDLVRSLDSENSLAMVLAHEIAHAKHRDPLLAAGRGVLIQLAISSLSGGGVDPGTIDLGTEAMLNTYSRAQEVAADRLALSALQERYQHVGGATDLFQLLKASGDSEQTVEFLSTHPDIDERILALKSMARANHWADGPTTPYPPAVIASLGGASSTP